MASARKVVGTLLVLAVVSVAGVLVFNRISERAIRKRVLEAYAAVSDVGDYSGNPAYPIADLTARQQLNALDAEDLSREDRHTVICMESYLGAIESLNSSSSIETTRLRESIAMDAAKKTDQCMVDFRRR